MCWGGGVVSILDLLIITFEVTRIPELEYTNRDEEAMYIRDTIYLC